MKSCGWQFLFAFPVTLGLYCTFILEEQTFPKLQVGTAEEEEEEAGEEAASHSQAHPDGF